ncbi:hypothetical protein BDV40DRAFT_276388 [Aspergillus tamarii]|uniref:Uncharacterized protein n=1 Tax=Aspergillus tamarii TaxID=41984 RepID=A0A5N6UHX4_ASPTM|nr:hypothetical protein BDV40DRAFT_276388 [Aspergillus tamarii]
MLIYELCVVRRILVQALIDAQYRMDFAVTPCKWYKYRTQAFIHRLEYPLYSCQYSRFIIYEYMLQR